MVSETARRNKEAGMEVFILVCLIAGTPANAEQRETAAKCHRTNDVEADCIGDAENEVLAFDAAPNTRSEGTLAGCIRKAS